MLNWDLEAVAFFLGVRPKHEDNSSYSFSFPLLGGVASLRIFPYVNRVDLIVEIAGLAHAARWSLDCDEIIFNDEIPEEGGPCIVFNPSSMNASKKQLTHWIVIGREGDQFQILTVFRDPDA